jgi:hypothetical protein
MGVCGGQGLADVEFEAHGALAVELEEQGDVLGPESFSMVYRKTPLTPIRTLVFLKESQGALPQRKGHKISEGSI